MVTIVTGPINTGKTTWLMKDYNSKENADGFGCRKVKEKATKTCGNER